MIVTALSSEVVTPSVYTTPIEAVTETASISKRCILRTIRVHLPGKRLLF